MHMKVAKIIGAAMLATSIPSSASGALEIYDFDGCVGPAGTPTSFTATKTSLPEPARGPVAAAAAFRLTDGGGVFIVLSFGEGNFSPPGIAIAGNATTTCSVNTSDGTFEFSGILAPAA